MENVKNENEVVIIDNELLVEIDGFVNLYKATINNQKDCCLQMAKIYNLGGKQAIKYVASESGLDLSESSLVQMANAGNIYMINANAEVHDYINLLSPSVAVELQPLVKAGKDIVDFYDDVLVDSYKEKLPTQKKMREEVKIYLSEDEDEVEDGTDNLSEDEVEDGTDKKSIGSAENDTAEDVDTKSKKDSEWACGFIDYLINSYEFDSNDIQSLQYLKKLL